MSPHHMGRNPHGVAEQLVALGASLFARNLTSDAPGTSRRSTPTAPCPHADRSKPRRPRRRLPVTHRFHRSAHRVCAPPKRRSCTRRCTGGRRPEPWCTPTHLLGRGIVHAGHQPGQCDSTADRLLHMRVERCRSALPRPVHSRPLAELTATNHALLLATRPNRRRQRSGIGCRRTRRTRRNRQTSPPTTGPPDYHCPTPRRRIGRPLPMTTTETSTGQTDGGARL
jgi:hypothetical protein